MMDSRHIIKMLEKDGWYKVATVGSHNHFKHPNKKGKVTVQHPKKYIPQKTCDSILKQTGLK